MSPFPLIFQSTAPAPGLIEGVAPGAWVYLTLVPLANGPKTVPVPRSTTKTDTLGSTASEPISRKNPSSLWALGTCLPPGLTPSGHAATGAEVSTQCLMTLTELLFSAILVVTCIVSVPRLEGATGTL